MRLSSYFILCLKLHVQTIYWVGETSTWDPNSKVIQWGVLPLDLLLLLGVLFHLLLINLHLFCLLFFLKSYNVLQWNFIYFCSLGMEPRPSRQVLYSWATPSDPVKFYFIYLIIFIISVWLEVNTWRSENHFLVGLCFHLLRILGTESWSPAFRVKIFTCWVLIDPPLKGYGHSCSSSWGFAVPSWRQPCSSVSCGSILRWPALIYRPLWTWIR